MATTLSAIIDDVLGVAKWGKDTISAIGNTARNSAQGAEKLAEALPDFLKKLLDGLGDAAETPYLTYLAMGAGGVAALMASQEVGEQTAATTA